MMHVNEKRPTPPISTSVGRAQRRGVILMSIALMALTTPPGMAASNLASADAGLGASNLNTDVSTHLSPQINARRSTTIRPQANDVRDMPLPESFDATRDDSAWWDDDVWSHPDRPFLFYGHHAQPQAPHTVESATDTENVNVTASQPEKKAQATLERASKRMDNDDHRKVASDVPTRLEDLKTVKALQEERERRLHVAIMNPTEANMAHFQEVNAYMLGLSHRFAAAWERSRLDNPEYDWTATHPTANFVRVADQEAVREAKAQYLQTLSGDIALVVVGHSDDPNTRLLTDVVSGVAQTYHYDTLGIVTNPEAFEQEAVPPSRGKAKETQSVLQKVFGDMPVKPNRGHVTQLGLTLFPAVVLVANNEATVRHPEFERLTVRAGARVALLATGVVSGEELERRLVRRLRADPTPRATAPERVPGADAFHTLPVVHDRGSLDAWETPWAFPLPSSLPANQERQSSKATKER